MKKRIGFFGGTFDPIHFGHLNLAVELKETCELDEILFCPAQVSPMKQNEPPIASGEHRFKMLKLALEGAAGLNASEIELVRPPPSYTIDSVRQLIKKWGNEMEFHLILAQDAVHHMASWKEIENLLELAPPFVGTRHGFELKLPHDLPISVKTKLEKGKIPIHAMDISSKRIKERLKKELYCGHLVPRKVLDYIYKNGLY